MSGLEPNSDYLLSKRLRERIIHYWNERERDVDVWIGEGRGPVLLRGNKLFPLQSNIINGWPEGKA